MIATKWVFFFLKKKKKLDQSFSMILHLGALELSVQNVN